GSSSYISTLNGQISQHVEYIAFGEVLFEEHSSSFKSPYLFNGKELDRETNLSFYGARYLDMKTSLWLNIDPLAEKFPHQSPYAFTDNNPINKIDPDGREATDWFKDKKGIIRYDKDIKTQADVDKVSLGGKYIAAEFNTKTANYYKDGGAFFKNESEGYQFMIDNSNMQSGKNETENLGFLTKSGLAVLPNEGTTSKGNDFKNNSLGAEINVQGYDRSGSGNTLSVDFQGGTIKPIGWVHTHPDSGAGHGQSGSDTQATRSLGVPSIIIGRGHVWGQSVQDANKNIGGSRVITRQELKAGTISIISNIKLLK
ncbi:RHS repeat-associated core domain-containing protein, partial [Flavobacterium psychrophilum]|nr:RHS repeat-associated core domain-containing protein [Flavobacterium psychrophilum]